jgi:hypothetical protein
MRASKHRVSQWAIAISWLAYIAIPGMSQCAQLAAIDCPLSKLVPVKLVEGLRPRAGVARPERAHGNRNQVSSLPPRFAAIPIPPPAHLDVTWWMVDKLHH